MRRFIRVSAVLVLLGLGIYGYHRKKDPKPRVKVPVTRYHGYELNRLAINRAKAFTVLISNEILGGGGAARGCSLTLRMCLHAPTWCKGRRMICGYFRIPSAL